MKVGFIGLGIMGRPMAGHLVKGGHQLCVYDHKPIPDHSAMVRALELMANHEIRTQFA